MVQTTGNRHFVQCCAAMAAVCMGLLTAPAGARAEAPHLVPVESRVDFGSVAQGNNAAFEFRLRNDGDAPLQIQEVRPSCGCTAALVSDDIVQPGGEARITGEVNTTGFQDRVTKTITVTSNDPQNPRMTLTVTGLVEVPFHLEPRYLNFGQVRVGEGAEETAVLTIKDPKKLPVTIGEASAGNEHVRVRVTPRAAASEAADTFDITVHLDAGAPQGVISTPILLPIENEDQPLRLSLYANVVGDVALYPQTVSLGLLERERDVVRNFVVMSPTNTAFEVREAVCDLPGCSVTVSPLDSADGTTQRIRITVTINGAQLSPGRVQGTLTVRTSAAEGSTLTAKLLGSVQELESQSG